MNSHTLVLRTGRFNRTKVGEHFINPFCFGEDFAGWLAQELIKKGVTVTRAAYQEDWGWEMAVAMDQSRYFIGIGPESEGPEQSDFGRWRIFLTRRRTLGERLTGRGRITNEDPLFVLIEQIANKQSDFDQIYRES